MLIVEILSITVNKHKNLYLYIRSLDVYKVRTKLVLKSKQIIYFN